MNIINSHDVKMQLNDFPKLDPDILGLIRKENLSLWKIKTSASETNKYLLLHNSEYVTLDYDGSLLRILSFSELEHLELEYRIILFENEREIEDNILIVKINLNDYNDINTEVFLNNKKISWIKRLEIVRDADNPENNKINLGMF